MPSLGLKLLNVALRRLVRAKLEDARAPLELRTRIKAPVTPVPFGATWRAGDCGAPGEFFAPRRGEAFGALLYLHGGGYISGSPATHRSIAGAFAAAGLDVFSPDYRLAPEHPFPAALKDALAAWRALRRRSAGPLFLAGDSAGGGLALSLSMALRDRGERGPDAAVLFSPWTDLTGASASLEANGGRDAMFPPHGMAEVGALYAAGERLSHPGLSPLFGDFSRLPPLMIFVGDQEILLDDSRHAAQKARAAGVETHLRVYADAPHVWPLFTPWVAESRAAFRESVDFLRSRAAPDRDCAPARRTPAPTESASAS